MELSYFFAQLFGAYFIIAGIVVFLRRKSIMAMVRGLSKNRSLILVVAAIELFAGLAVVLSHPIFTFDWRGIISFIGAWMVVEGLFFLAMPARRAQAILRECDKVSWYTGGSFLAVVLGVYLAGIGFGLW